MTAIQAEITPTQVATMGCRSNPLNPTFAAARLYGAFFNTGTPTRGSHVNDIIARILMGRSSTSTDPANILRVNARVYRCLDGNQLHMQDLGPIMLRRRTTLTL